LVLSAQPKSGWTELSKIYLRFSWGKKILSLVELYGKQGQVVSTTIYYDPVAVPGTAGYFPSRTATWGVLSGQYQSLKTQYTRLVFNRELSPEQLKAPGPALLKKGK